MKNLTKKERIAVEEFRKRLFENFGSSAHDAFLFGSKARGQARQTSDIDILVILASRDIGIKKEILNLAFDIILEYSVDLSVIVIYKSDWNKYLKLPTSFSFNVQKDAARI